MLDELIETFEELKKSVFIIDRGTQGIITIRFENKHFYHLVGLHKTNINMFFPFVGCLFILSFVSFAGQNLLV